LLMNTLRSIPTTLFLPFNNKCLCYSIPIPPMLPILTITDKYLTCLILLATN
ncbi:24059_t:CDS:1, partial [Gigaspora margarita]